MDTIQKIKWQFGGNLNRNNIPGDDIGVYLHVLRSRIVYVGSGQLKSCQSRHYTKLKRANCTFYNLRKINEQKILDLYELICKGKYQDSLNTKFLLNSSNVDGLEELQEIIEMNLNETNVFYSIVGETEMARKIEAGLQWKLIRKFEMDPYEVGYYPIGFTPEHMNRIDDNLIFENDFSEVLS